MIEPEKKLFSMYLPIMSKMLVNMTGDFQNNNVMKKRLFVPDT
jgi:hypothetical protein